MTSKGSFHGERVGLWHRQREVPIWLHSREGLPFYASPQITEGRAPPPPLVTYNNLPPWNSNLAALLTEWSRKKTLLIQSEPVVAVIHLN